MAECQGTPKPHRDPVRKVTVLPDHFFTGDYDESYMSDRRADEDDHYAMRGNRVTLGKLLPVNKDTPRGHWRITAEFVPHEMAKGGESPWYSERNNVQGYIYVARRKASGGEQGVCDPHAEGHARCKNDESRSAAARTPAAEVPGEGSLADG